jgi:RIO kinase 1
VVFHRETDIGISRRYFRGQIYVIDVSQSVEDDHPNSMEFLRKDCLNVHDYFLKKFKLPVLTVRELFEFVVDKDFGVDDESVDRHLELLQERCDKQNKALDDHGTTGAAKSTWVDDNVFMNSYIPRSLEEVANVERDVMRVQNHEAEQLIYHKIAGVYHQQGGMETAKAPQDDLLAKVMGLNLAPSPGEDASSDDSSADSDSDDNSNDSGDDASEGGSDEEEGHAADGPTDGIKSFDKAARKVSRQEN